MAGLLEALANYKHPGTTLPRLPPHPESWTAPQIPVMGNPILANLVFLLQQREPGLGRLVSKVQPGPTEGVIRDWTRAKMPIQDFDKYDLLGAFDPKKKDIYIQPGSMLNRTPTPGHHEDDGVDNPSLQQILFHEIAHAKGANETGARRVHRAMDPRLHEVLYNQIVRRLKLDKAR